MTKALLTPIQKKNRLSSILIAFFLALSLPLYYLLQTVYTQLENEAYFNSRQQAESLIDQLEINLQSLLEPEQNRPIAEYRFFNVMENPLLSETSGIKFSPLSEIPPKTEIQGMVGYFQINTDGSFHLPALPELGEDNLSGLSLAELENRLALKHKLRRLLSIKLSASDNNRPSLVRKRDKRPESDDKDQPYKDEFKQKKIIAKNKNELVRKTKQKQRKVSKAASPSPYSSFKDRMASSSIARSKVAETRKEIVQLPDQSMASQYFKLPKQQQIKPVLSETESFDLVAPKQNLETNNETQSMIHILSIESEVTSLKSLIVGQQYLCLYRYVWHDNQRYTQGFIVESKSFFNSSIQPLLINSSFSRLTLLNNYKVIHTININTSDQESLLYSRKLAQPFQELELKLYIAKLATVPGSLLIDILAVSIYAIFIIGLITFYRLGSRQIDLAKQQQNFISAVSHELKTPLTSIRMYGEMLRSGWVENDKKKQTYYDFIYFESERLSRLISNVLHLARLGHQKHQPEIKIVTADELLEQVSTKTSAQIEASAFTLNIIPGTISEQSVNINVDQDAFFQIIINLIDNAIKFSNTDDKKQIDIGYSVSKNKQHLAFYVRDYGPGIKKDQIKKIFQLFYRSGDELTRTTPGTGIGLALVAQLAETMNATVSVINKQPGTEFKIQIACFKPRKIS